MTVKFFSWYAEEEDNDKYKKTKLDNDYTLTTWIDNNSTILENKVNNLQNVKIWSDASKNAVNLAKTTFMVPKYYLVDVSFNIRKKF